MIYNVIFIRLSALYPFFLFYFIFSFYRQTKIILKGEGAQKLIWLYKDTKRSNKEERETKNNSLSLFRAG